MSLSHLQPQSPDPLLSLIGDVRRDPRRGKIDLSVGVYRDESGCTPVMAAVKQAERLLLEGQESKSYLGPEGDEAFVAHVADLLLGTDNRSHVRGIQTPGGTAALRLAADLLALGDGSRRIWVGLPTWSNHLPILAAAGLDIRTFDAYDTVTQSLRVEATLAALNEARPGDAVLLQACCHNPTGMDPDAATWTAITDILVQRNLLPLLDIAYQGLGDGLDEDAWALRVIVEAVPEAIIAYSCNKNFGLYRDRVGALFVTGPSDAAVECAIGNAKTIARTSYSMPPDHGAAVVRLILGDQALTAMWRDELNAMRARLLAIRQALADAGMAGTLDLTTVAQQKGMFSLLPLGRDLIDRLRMEHAIYMAPNGRVNLAGLPMAGVGQFVDALRAVARHKAA
ncbi:MAG: hypothetical protein DI547_06190 [Sphingobium sp.]|nr:MAG: hypothetical protein DI547_06190 [Sphingobium sp.]